MEILEKLGFKSLNDFSTIVDINIFKNINIETVRKSLIENNIDTNNLEDTEESKFEKINLILMLRHGRFIDEIKSPDELGTIQGYKLEIMPV